MSDSSNDNDSYFADPNGVPTHHPPTSRARTDEQGYVIRRSVLEEGTRPEYIIPVGSADGVWGMMKRVGRFRPEGWLALWKGTVNKIFYLIIAFKGLNRAIDVVCNGSVIRYITAFHQRVIAGSILPINVPISPATYYPSCGIASNHRISVVAT